jgi:hypothetical protein
VKKKTLKFSSPIISQFHTRISKRSEQACEKKCESMASRCHGFRYSPGLCYLYLELQVQKKICRRHDSGKKGRPNCLHESGKPWHIFNKQDTNSCHNIRRYSASRAIGFFSCGEHIATDGNPRGDHSNQTWQHRPVRQIMSQLTAL